MVALKVRRIGNSLGVVLPKEVVHRLKLAEGDELILTEAPDGYRVTPGSEGFKRAMEAFEEGRQRYRNALRELAK